MRLKQLCRERTYYYVCSNNYYVAKNETKNETKLLFSFLPFFLFSFLSFFLLFIYVFFFFHRWLPGARYPTTILSETLFCTSVWKCTHKLDEQKRKKKERKKIIVYSVWKCTYTHKLDEQKRKKKERKKENYSILARVFINQTW